jgi:hypothetical protein
MEAGATFPLYWPNEASHLATSSGPIFTTLCSSIFPAKARDETTIKIIKNVKLLLNITPPLV